MKLTKKIFALGVFAAMMAFCLVPGFAFADDVQDPVAKIGNTGYATLGEAFDAVQDGETVILQKSVSDCVSFDGLDGKSCKLNLKGFQLKNGSGTVADGNATITVKSGSLEIFNGSIYRGASVSSDYSDRAAVYVCSGANVTLTNVDVESNNDYAIQVGSDSVSAGTLTVNSGSSISVGSAAALPLYVPSGNVTINGGTFGTKGTSTAIKLDSGSVNIKDGSFSGNLIGDGTYTLEGGEYSDRPAFGKIAEGFYPFVRENDSELYPFQVLSEAAAKETAAAKYEAGNGNYAFYENLEEAKGVVPSESDHHLLTIFVDATLAAPENLTYDGNPKAVTPSLPSEVLDHYVSQSIVYSGGDVEGPNAPTDAGTYIATLNGLDVRSGYELQDEDYRYELHKPATLEYTISPASIEGYDVTLNLDEDALVYDGTAKEPEVESVGSLNPSDYDVTYENNVNAGEATVVITGKGNYTGTATETFTISKRSISEAEVNLDPAELTYNGKPQIQEVTSVYVNVGSDKLEVPLDDLDVEGEATNAGTHTITLTAKDNTNFTGSCTKDFTIKPLSINDATVKLEDYQPVYNGKPQLQGLESVTVGSGEDAVEVDLDSLEIAGEATNAGTHTMTLTAKDGTNFTDSCTVDFTIKKLSIDAAIVTFGPELTYNGKEQVQTIDSIFVGKGDRAVEVDLDSIEVTGNKVTDAGSHMVTIAAKDDTNFTGHKKLSFVVNALDLSKAKLTLTKTEFVYNGKVQRPGLKSVVLNGKYLKDGVEFTTSVPDGKKVGTYQVTITGNGYGYTGTASATFTVNPLAVGDFKVAKGKKSFKATWSKFKAQRDGVEIKYSTKKSMAKAKTVKAKGAAAKAKTVKKLKKKTKYYVQVRAYKVVNGKTYYSEWSAKKAVKTK